jgi:hypothetical protein
LSELKEQMAMKVSVMAAGLAVTGLVVGASVTGCGGSEKSSTSSSSSTASSSSAATTTSAAAPSSSATAQPGDYASLLIKPADIVVPGDTFTLTNSTPTAGSPGVEGIFNNRNGSRTVDISIFVYPDAATASQALDVSAKAIPEISVKAQPSPADVGTGGQMAVGPSPDGNKAKGVVMFTEGKAFVVVELSSGPNDPVQPDFLLDLGRKQDAAVKAGLPA